MKKNYLALVPSFFTTILHFLVELLKKSSNLSKPYVYNARLFEPFSLKRARDTKSESWRWGESERGWEGENEAEGGADREKSTIRHV